MYSLNIGLSSIRTDTLWYTDNKCTDTVARQWVVNMEPLNVVVVVDTGDRTVIGIPGQRHPGVITLSRRPRPRSGFTAS